MIKFTMTGFNSNYKIIIAIMLALSLALAGCSAKTQDTRPNNETEEQKFPEPKAPPQKGVQREEKEIDPIEEQIKNMTLNEKVGQMVMVGLDGYAIDDSARTMVESYQVGGFILFGRNVESSEQLLDLINSLKRSNSKNKAPLFLSVDEEGGKVSRMPGELKKLPANKTIGKVNNVEFSYKIGSILAEEVKSFGFNMNFAPVLDINSNPQNPVIGDRSFGSDGKIVSELGVQTMRGIQAGGVIPVVKHFPGHGDTSVDSHVDLPSVDNDMDRLKSFELVPFKEAIQNQADAVMVAHILLNKIDPQNPASLSKIIITDFLRKQLNFSGVIITDDMTMGAIVKNYDMGDAAVKSVNAGSDIVLVCHGYDSEVAVIDALKKAVQDGVISEDRMNESVYRILKLKNKYKLTDNIIDSIDVEKINAEISQVLDTYMQK
jgi:beta-N-acetylhexosaminidase